MNILILGGTGDARELASRLASIDATDATLSLAGRTQNPIPHRGKIRIGGFGGVESLEKHLIAARIDLLIDATHPFAARISANAARAAQNADVPLLVLDRPQWEPLKGDDWRDADDSDHAVLLIGNAPKRVFLAIGRQEVGAFKKAPQHHYVIRSVDPVEPELLPNDAAVILARGPFDKALERQLLIDRKIDVVVSKNSGGDATYGKIAAARELGLPVIMIARPVIAGGERFASVTALEARIRHYANLLVERGE